jgi:hypothetical protein
MLRLIRRTGVSTWYPSFRPLIAAAIAFTLYSPALPESVFVYWTMALVAVAAAFTLFRLAQLIECIVESCLPTRGPKKCCA